MQNHNDDTIMTSDTVLQKNIPLTLFERVVCERELETEQNCKILTPTLLAITAFSFPFLLSCSTGGLGPSLSECWFSLSHLISNSPDPQLADFLSSPGLYNDLTPTLLPAIVTIALIQHVHGQGYNILIDPRPDAPVIYAGAFPSLTVWLDRRSICNIIRCFYSGPAWTWERWK